MDGTENEEWHSYPLVSFSFWRGGICHDCVLVQDGPSMLWSVETEQLLDLESG